MRKYQLGWALAGVCLFANPSAPRASETLEDADGILNPQELTIEYFAHKADERVFDPQICRYGYPAAKMGDHVTARKIFERCSKEGVLAAMPWMAWTEENGYDKPSDPAKAAEWDRRAAEAGYSIGEFNYGLDLLRGHGVPRDEIRGRSFIDQAAKQGNSSAADVAAHGYDPETQTPDADKDRYRDKIY